VLNLIVAVVDGRETLKAKYKTTNIKKHQLHQVTEIFKFKKFNYKDNKKIFLLS
jgi:hypothetical protein